MKRLLWGIPGSGKIPYFRKVLRTRPGNLVGYWPMWESSGSDALDLSPQGNNGAYTTVTLGETGIGDGRTCPSFDGSASFNDVYSAALASDFSGSEGTIAGWVKLSQATWEDGIERQFMYLSSDSDNIVRIYKSATNNRLVWIFRAGGTNKNITKNTVTSTDWLHLALTWSVSADNVCAYMQGAQEGSTLTTVPAWAGVLAATTTVIGAASTSPSYVFSGSLAHWCLWNVALTASEIANLARV